MFLKSLTTTLPCKKWVPSLRPLWVLILGPVLATSAVVSQPKLEVRLQSYLTSYASPPGTPFRCIVIRSFELGGHVLIPKGSMVYGTVRKESPVGIGIVHERAGLELNFREFETPDGERFPLNGHLASIDNAREQVMPNGKIKGVLAANNPGNLLNGFWARPSSNIVFRSVIGLTGAANQVWARYSMGPIGAAGLFVARCFIVAFPEPEISLPPGTDMKLTIQPPPVAPDSEAVNAPPVLLVKTAGGISSWLDGKLDPISFRNGQAAPDLFNVIILGSRQEIISAFVTSGWSRADHRSLRASSHVYACFSSMRSYAAAPVSRLYYHGAEPDLVFEKSLDTVTQRHHVRFWNVGVFDDQTVWLGAATHDTGVQFKLRSMAFTHKIDRNIDGERDKISTDLGFSGCSGDAASFDGTVDSPTYHSSRVSTDGRVTVLAAQPCIASADPEEKPKAPGNKLSRLTRRVILEARNYLERDNAYYWGYRMIRSRMSVKQPVE